MARQLVLRNLEASQAKPDEQMTKATEIGSTIASFNSLDLSPSTTTSSTSYSPPKKPKVKTRPAAEKTSITSSDSKVEPIQDLEDDARPTVEIEVGPRSLCLFERMFSRIGEAQSCTKWEDFAAALHDAGCLAVHNGGSAVTFTDERNHKGRITVHRPHYPEPEYSLVKLRGIRGRLRKRFGWSETTFVKRTKKENRTVTPDRK